MFCISEEVNNTGNLSLKYSADVQLNIGQFVATDPAVLKFDAV